ncbi:unannotated protein [freshwater metagenome]|uniref:Unannotated protein n=1 Tax=freshwater metagenome TaxID=449393 RepID=A0A6J7IY35_9ZZZZ
MREQGAEGPGVATEGLGTEPLKAARGQLLANHERAQPDGRGDAEPRRLDHGGRVG